MRVIMHLINHDENADGKRPTIATEGEPTDLRNNGV